MRPAHEACNAGCAGVVESKAVTNPTLHSACWVVYDSGTSIVCRQSVSNPYVLHFSFARCVISGQGLDTHMADNRGGISK